MNGIGLSQLMLLLLICFKGYIYFTNSFVDKNSFNRSIP